MSSSAVRVCQCPSCEQDAPHPDRERHRQMNIFLSRLDEAQRRWYVALEAERLATIQGEISRKNLEELEKLKLDLLQQQKSNDNRLLAGSIASVGGTAIPSGASGIIDGSGSVVEVRAWCFSSGFFLASNSGRRASACRTRSSRSRAALSRAAA